MNKGDLVESFLEMAVYLTFTHLIPNEILHVYLPEKYVGMTYPRHTPKTWHGAVLPY